MTAKLLLTKNLSPRLVNLLNDLFPNSLHVSTPGLGTASDRVVRDYARDNDYIIVTKDTDFSDFVMILGFPPKIVWIRRGNCSTSDLESLLRTNQNFIENLNNDANAGILTLF